MSYQISSFEFFCRASTQKVEIGWLNKGTQHSETGQKINKLVRINLSRLIMHIGFFREKFFSEKW